MSAKEFFTAIDMLETYNKIMNITRINEQTKPCAELDTRELGRYKSYVYREKLLKREILELTQSAMRVEKLAKQREIQPELIDRDYKRGRCKMIDLWLELSKVMLRKRELEKSLEEIPSPFVRKVVRHRYFNDNTQRLHSWAQTASELDLPMTGVQLRGVITKALRTGIF